MNRIDYQTEGNRVYIDARDMSGLLLSMCNNIKIELDKDTLLSINELIISMINTVDAEEAEDVIKIDDEKLVKIIKEVKKNK